MSSPRTDLSRRAFLQTTALAAAALGTSSQAGWSSPAASHEVPADVPGPLSLWYAQPAANWNEALPLGNGRLGVMVFGGKGRERLQLNEETIWTGRPDREENYRCDGPKALAEIRRLTFEDKWSEAQALFGKAMVDHWFSKYQPMCDLWLEFPGHEDCRDYRRELSLDSAVAVTTYKIGEVTFRREFLLSAVDQVLAGSITADRDGEVSFTARLAGAMDYGNAYSGGGGTIAEDGAKGTAIGTIGVEAGEPGEVVLHGKVTEGVITYEVRLRVLADGGTLRVEGDRIRVEKARGAVLLLAAGTNFKNFQDVSGDPGPAVLAQLTAAEKKSYPTLRADHVRDHQQLFHRVSLTLPTSPSSGLPTDQRLAAMRRGEDDPALAALLFQFGRFLVISSSRPGTLPPNLQGIWNGDRNPAWDSKFTTNINLQMNYYPVDVANLGECIEPLLRFCEEMTVTGGWAAKRCFGARGWTLSFNTDLWRGVWPNGGEISFWSTWPAGGAWLCNRLYDHYRFTGDRKFLERLYPVLKSSAEFFLDTLQEHPTRKYLVTNPSMSPENRHHKIEGKSWALQPSICAGPTMDNQILREHFDACAAAAGELQRDEDFIRQVTDARGRLAPTPVGRYGQIQEWLEDWDNPEDRHRHVSQLYGLYPGCEITPDATPDLVKAARVTLEHRGLASTGWSTAWKIAMLARMRDGETANRIVQYLLGYRPIRKEDQGEGANSGGVYPNLLSICPPMQIDANFGACAGIAEMLLQSHAGEMHLLPAIPQSWPSGEVKGLCARGAFEVDIAWNDGKLTKAAVHSKLGKPCVVRYGDRRLRIESKPGTTHTFEYSAAAGFQPARQRRAIAGWAIHVSTYLLDHEPDATACALELLQAQLEAIGRDVPPAAVAELRKVPLWISPTYPGVRPRAEYHPDAQWLRDNGRDPAMAKSVEFTNVPIFKAECRRMPVFVLHELAHAYQDLVLGGDNAEITAAYQQAKAGGKYDRVKRRDAAGNERYDRAYALSNPMEYLAETTEAFFGVNDFFPFTRAELEKHDPEMFSLLKRLWKVN